MILLGRHVSQVFLNFLRSFFLLGGQVGVVAQDGMQKSQGRLSTGARTAAAAGQSQQFAHPRGGKDQQALIGAAQALGEELAEEGSVAVGEVGGLRKRDFITGRYGGRNCGECGMVRETGLGHWSLTARWMATDARGKGQPGRPASEAPKPKPAPTGAAPSPPRCWRALR